MDIAGLDRFIRNAVPNGFVPVDIQEEIRTCGRASGPVIVVDLFSLYAPLSEQDTEGLFCGGRFNVAYCTIDDFFGKLVSLGARLKFFYDGPVDKSRHGQWQMEQDQMNRKHSQLIKSVDGENDVGYLMKKRVAPHNYFYPLRYVAQKHGTLVVSMVQECHQQLASYASKVGALAVIASDADFLIYEGDWRFWSSRDIDFKNLKTKEFNRKALLSHLELSFKQMPLFGMLARNFWFKKIWKSFGTGQQKFHKLAEYVRELSVLPDKNNIFERVYEDSKITVRKGMQKRFKQLLQIYQSDYVPPNLNPKRDKVQAFLLSQDTALFYQIWHGMPIAISVECIDMRCTDFGPESNQLLVILILRMAGIIRFNRRNKPDSSTCEIVTKLKHDGPHKLYRLQVVFPKEIQLPPLDKLMSEEPKYLDIKYQLCGWVVSDQFDPLALKSIPDKFLVTVLTLCYLVDMQVIKMFEADLFLQMAYDMVHNTYDMHAVRCPERLEGRPFRLAFLYQKVYVLVARVVRLVGLGGKDFRDDPIFDGFLFHNRYDGWRKQENTIELEPIKEWRIYDFKKV